MTAPHQIRAIVFDKDGTLFDFRATWDAWGAGVLRDLADGDTDLHEALARALDFDLTTGSFAPTSLAIAGTNTQIAQALAAPMSGDVDVVQLEREIVVRAAHAPLQPAVPLEPLLKTLRASGRKLGVMTNDSESVAHAHLGSAGVTELFDFIAGADSGFGAKPSPAPLLAFCDRAGVDPSEAAMVGDSTHDLHAAQAAGMLAIGVQTGVARLAELAPHADLVLNDIGELPEWLGLRTP